ncbi:MAG: hypothetical protein IJV29_17170 [Butyrivibrio sp.]|nr:hypothetical protein [Butyrivibrio sp.]
MGREEFYMMELNFMVLEDAMNDSRITSVRNVGYLQILVGGLYATK